MAEKKGKTEKFETKCTRLRMLMLYFDTVNEAGFELTKLNHQAGQYAGEKHDRCMVEMRDFAAQNGFFFYDKDDHSRLMRAALTPGNEAVEE